MTWQIRTVDQYTQRTLLVRRFASRAAAERHWEQRRGYVGEGLYMALPERSV